MGWKAHISANAIARGLLIALLAFGLASCAVGTRGNPAATQTEPEVFRVGEVEVRLYRDRQKMLKDLPPFFALLEASRVADRQITTRGFYDSQNKRIYAIDDARTVIHEFKHYLEPSWRHGMEPASQELSQGQIESTSQMVRMIPAGAMLDSPSQ